MKGILSQNEIDDLLRKVTGPKTLNLEALKSIRKNDKIKPYDFRRPSKFTHDQIRVLSDIHGDFARLSSMVLSDWLRTPCFVELQYIEEQTFFEYTNTLLNSSAIGVIDIQPLGGDMVLEISHIAANSMVNLLMGGSPEEGAVKQDFTEIELMLIRKALERFLLPLRNAWLNYVELTPVLTRVETNGQRAQITGPNEVVSIVTFKISVGSEEGILNCCIPSALLDPINSRLDRKNRFSIVRTPTENNEETIKENIRNIAVDVKCELGKSLLTLDEIEMLQPGDVIRIHRKVGEPVDVTYNALTKFKADIGTRNGKYAVKIVRRLGGDEENG